MNFYNSVALTTRAVIESILFSCGISIFLIFFGVLAFQFAGSCAEGNPFLGSVGWNPIAVGLLLAFELLVCFGLIRVGLRIKRPFLAVPCISVGAMVAWALVLLVGGRIYSEFMAVSPHGFESLGQVIIIMLVVGFTYIVIVPITLFKLIKYYYRLHPDQDPFSKHMSVSESWHKVVLIILGLALLVMMGIVFGVQYGLRLHRPEIKLLEQQRHELSLKHEELAPKVREAVRQHFALGTLSDEGWQEIDNEEKSLNQAIEVQQKLIRDWKSYEFLVVVCVSLFLMIIGHFFMSISMGTPVFLGSLFAFLYSFFSTIKDMGPSLFSVSVMPALISIFLVLLFLDLWRISCQKSITQNLN